MSLLGHIAVGVSVARGVTRTTEPRPVLDRRMVGLAGLAMLPDIDFLLHDLAPRVALFDHRGPSHSLLVAVVVGSLVGLVLLARGHPDGAAWGLLAIAVVASHGLLDLFGDTTLGVALLWPISDARILAPWHILPNPPAVLSWGTLWDVGVEAVVFVPAWLYAFWPRRQRDREPGA
jgi:inner membrane protein